MQKSKRYPEKIISHLLSLGLAILLAACDLPASPKTSSWDAEDYFKGKAVELADASMQGDVIAIKSLMKEEGVNPDIIFSEGAMPLLAWPILTESPEGLKAMLENGANPNARWPTPTVVNFKDGSGGSYYENNAMVMAAGWPDPQYLKLLLEHGGDPNTKNSNNESLLFQAWIKQRQWPNIQLLIEHGANINQSNGDDGGYDTVISWYSDYSNFDKVYWLLQNGADPTLRAHGKFHPPEGSMVIAEDIYWLPAYPEMIPWQRKCQHWLRDHGIKRADKIPLRLRHHREGLGLPTDEKNIPLL